MQIQGPHNGSGSADGIFVHVANGSTSTAIAEGESVIWDSAATGTNCGFYVKQGVAHSAQGTGANPLGGLNCGIAAEAGPVLVGTSPTTFLVQVYGRRLVTVSNPAANTVAGEPVAADASGGLDITEGAGTAGTKYLGYMLEAITSGGGDYTKYMMISCMG
jgi:hypothetical protein